MKKLLPFIALFILGIANSCTKMAGYNVTPATATTGTTGTTGSTGTTTASTSTDYLPLTAGTFWTYMETVGSTIDTVTNKLTGTTSTINGKLYYNITSTSQKTGTTTGYFSAIDHVYTERTTVSGIGTVEFLYLKDNLAVGGTWTTSFSDSGTINGLPSQLLGKITEINISHTVQGKTYSSVIHTTLQIQYNYGTGFTTASTYEFYTAKGIGIIDIESLITLPGSAPITGSTLLINYSIK